VRKILAVCEKNPIDEVKLDYDEHNPFTPCGYTFKPIYRGTPSVKCPYCATHYQTQFKGKLCNICQLSEVCTGF
jgi:coatomer protein complex subunit alpha (xenin)